MESVIHYLLIYTWIHIYRPSLTRKVKPLVSFNNQKDKIEPKSLKRITLSSLKPISLDHGQ